MTTDIVTPHSGSRFLTGDWRASVVTLVVVARHVCIVTETYPPEINGVASTLAQLASGMRERGHTVSLVRPRQPAVDLSRRASEPRTLLVGGMRLPGYKGLRMGFPAGAALRTAWSRSRPDAVYVATEGLLGWSAVRAGAALGIPVYSGFHTNFDRYMQHYGAGWLRRPMAAYLRRFHNTTAGTLVSTPRLSAELAAAGFERLGVLGRGVDGARFDPARRSATLRAEWGAARGELVDSHRRRTSSSRSRRTGRCSRCAAIFASWWSVPALWARRSRVRIPIWSSVASGRARTSPRTTPPPMSFCFPARRRRSAT